MNTKGLFITLASGIFIGAALFDNFPETKAVLGITLAIGYTALGIIFWYALKQFTGLISSSSFAIVSVIGFLLHSILEGAAVGVAFLAGIKIGLIVALAMFLHLFPEFFAIVGILRGEQVSYRKSVAVDIGGIITLILSSFSFYFFLSALGVNILAIARALVGGAFLYIGLVSFWKQKKERMAIAGLLGGLIIILIWGLFFNI